MSFFTQGFERFSAQLSDAECSSIIRHLDQSKTVGTRRLLEHSWCQTLASTVQHRLADTLPELSSLQVVQCTYFNKSVNANWLVAFHQDRSIPVSVVDVLGQGIARLTPQHYSGYSVKEGMTFIHGPDHLLVQMIALRLHLDDSTSDNGPLRVLPGTHNHGTLSQSQIQALRQTIDAQPLTIAKGGIIALRPMLLHASSKSQTTEPRRVLHFLFGPSDLPQSIFQTILNGERNM